MVQKLRQNYLYLKSSLLPVLNRIEGIADSVSRKRVHDLSYPIPATLILLSPGRRWQPEQQQLPGSPPVIYKLSGNLAVEWLEMRLFPSLLRRSERYDLLAGSV